MQIRPGTGGLEYPALPTQQLGVILGDRVGKLVTGQHAQLHFLHHHRIERTFILNRGTEIEDERHFVG
jgi:hypothetical protein